MNKEKLELAVNLQLECEKLRMTIAQELAIIDTAQDAARMKSVELSSKIAQLGIVLASMEGEE